MDEKPDQIMSHIESQRDQLGRNLNELETRVKSTTDWRTQFDRNPMLAMGVALGGGLLLGTMVGGGKKRSGRSSWSSSSKNYASGAAGAGASYGLSSSGSGSSSSSSSSSSSPALREQRRKATDTLEHIKAALVGFATAKVKEFMTEALPGFNQHLDEAERRNSSMQGGSGSGTQHDHTQQHQSGSYDQASTRGEQSGGTPYSQQPAGGVSTGLNTAANTGLNI